MNDFFNNTDYFTSYLSDEAQTLISLLISVVVGMPLAILSVTANIINVTVFIKMGGKDPMNISLLGMSVSDLCGSVFVIWVFIHYFPGFLESDLPFANTMYLFGVYPRDDLARITGSITAFISIERCLCVTFPLLIKELITPKRVRIITVGFFVFSIITKGPMYIFSRIVPVFDSTRNKTIYTVFRYNQMGGSWTRTYEFVIGTVFSIGLTLINFLIIIVSTIILIQRLKKSSKWRNQATKSQTTTNPSDTASGTLATRSGTQMSTRDNKVAKMVVAISTIFIVCYTPVVVAVFSFLLIPGLSWTGKYVEFHPLMYFIMSTLESINAAVNILVYYQMSSNYKAMFQRIFWCHKRKSECKTKE